MAYNNFFPATYQQYYPQYQSNSMQMNNNNQSQQMMSPPTIHAEIIQVSGKEEALNFPVGAGQTQMMMSRDDQFIFIKTVYANGQSTLIEYARKQPESEKPNTEYVTREEFEKRIAEIVNSHAVVQTERETINEQSV